MSRAESNGSKKSIFFSIFAPFNELLFRSIMQSTRARARCRAARDNHVSVGAALIWRGAIDRFHSRSDCLSNHIFLHRRPSIGFTICQFRNVKVKFCCCRRRRCLFSLLPMRNMRRVWCWIFFLVWKFCSMRRPSKNAKSVVRSSASSSNATI